MDKDRDLGLGGKAMPGLGVGANYFVDTCFTKGVGLYDFLSDFSHPLLTAILRQTTKADADGVISRPWRTPLKPK